jgi:hypothetical protein
MLPARFIADPAPLPAAHPAAAMTEMRFVDGDSPQVRVSVARFAFDGVTALRQMPTRSGALPEAFAAGYISGMDKTSPGSTIVPGEYDATRHAFSARIVGRAASPARVLAIQPDDAPAWRQLAASGGDIARTRCLLQALLKDGDNFALDRATPRFAFAAKTCRFTEDDVAAFVRAQPAGYFMGAPLTQLAINYLMPEAITVITVSGPSAQTAQLEQLMSSIWLSAKVEHSAAPSRISRLVDFSDVQAARWLGVVMGAMVAGAIVFALFGWLLSKLGASIAVALTVPAVLLASLVLFDAMRSEPPSAYITGRLFGYAIAGVSSLRPLQRWLRSRALAVV